MKKVYEMLHAPRIIVREEDEDGFAAQINMPKWQGSIIVSWGGGWEHVSVAPYKRHITPSWDEMCYIKNLFWEKEECVVEYHPAESQYVNNLQNCLHLWKPVRGKFPCPPPILVGIRPGQREDRVRQDIMDVYPIKKAIKQIVESKYPQQDITTTLNEQQLTTQQAAEYGWKMAIKTAFDILVNLNNEYEIKK